MRASVLRPEEAALLAGVVANPSGYDPVAHPVARRAPAQPRPAADVRAGPPRRGCSTSTRARRRCPAAPEPPTVRDDRAVLHDLDPPAARRPLRRAPRLRGRAEDHDDPRRSTCSRRPRTRSSATSRTRTGPTAAVVALDNDTGEVRAMVGGRDYHTRPFNLATQGQRQPGSAIKPFILAEALRRGISPASVWPSRSASSTCRAAATSSSSTTSRAATRGRTRSRAR